MEIKFDRNQAHQTAAVVAVDRVLRGQAAWPGSSMIALPDSDIGAVLPVANSIRLDRASLLANIRDVQEAADLPLSDEIGERLELTIEMETGTGKTYAYLKTIQELRRSRGLTKFVIVAPSVAIREGIAKSVALTRDHFSSIYGNDVGTLRTYNRDKLSILRQFAQSDHIEILLIGLDSFNKESNVIYQQAEELGFARPIEFVSMCQPVVILDEPQNMDTEIARAAISRLNPIMVLRYSATHRSTPNLVYRLDPVEAYNRGLVKKIDVLSVTDEQSFEPRIELESVSAKRGSVAEGRAKIWMNGPQGPSLKGVRFRFGSDFEQLSRGRGEYQGYVVGRIDLARERIGFTNGVSMRVGEVHGLDLMARQRLQVRETIKEHLERELAHAEVGLSMKVLTVFFIDRVHRYAEQEGELRGWFEQEYENVASQPRFARLCLPAVADAHRGYFAERGGKPVDTKGASTADRDAYELIMRDKERLLDPAEPVRFIFSHSALREGWDNPNVFQICTLNLTKSVMKKRQEIGRGLRLPVQKDGTRVTDPDVARLTVVANESYEEFARDLQKELEEDCGVSFSGTTNRREIVPVSPIPDWAQSKYLQQLWSAVAPETSYRVALDLEGLIRSASDGLAAISVGPSRHVVAAKVALEITAEGVAQSLSSIDRTMLGVHEQALDLRTALTALHSRTGLTRRTLLRILARSGRLSEILENRAALEDAVAGEINRAIAQEAHRGIKYRRTGRVRELASLDMVTRVPSRKSLPTTKSIYARVAWQSGIEERFAKGLESRADVLYFLKVPSTYRIDTLLGPHVPDWGIVLKSSAGKSKVVVVETKGDPDQLQLRQIEWVKIRCATEHFACLGVEYRVLTDICDL